MKKEYPLLPSAHFQVRLPQAIAHNEGMKMSFSYNPTPIFKTVNGVSCDRQIWHSFLSN
ncbi:hypothetical protein [Dendronalium sp. ChiSLP03b]|uniref:hypothetical protein n=1 Tax=Dendronalium sp. ChiSLP03b TaxID=3075381 RepID=UPI00391D5323